eukprot:TRINITY_DN4727_c0_g1_i1.p1 TRINITY_DN4727_c0_g1~~TRINITY_DN4727_c0_g1_i1.p1  ORF type:complete len:457 (-),score=93.96 TRINITY_DN4727_c0_g1_i1:550-1920(-)
MACQGCGRNSEARLCCPTCIELGRTTYFCGQECFAANWQSHNQVHKLLRQQAASAAGSRGRGGQRALPIDPVPQSTAPLPRAQLDDLTGARGRRGLTPPPLPGGTSLVSHFAQGRRSDADTKKSDAVANGGGFAAPLGLGSVFDNLVKQASALVSGSGATAGTSGAGSSSAAASRERTASGDRGSQVSKNVAASASATRTRRFAQTGLGALGVLIIFGGGIYHFAFQQYADDAGLGDAEIAAPRGRRDLFNDPPPVASGEAARLDGGDSEQPKAPPTAAPVSELEALRSEVVSLRGRLDRHDQMLQYIVKHYVEKGSTGDPSGASSAGALGAGIGAFETKLVRPENLTAAAGAGFTARDAVVGRASEDSVRKRRRGEDAGLGREAAGLGEPGLNIGGFGGPVQADGVGQVSLEGAVSQPQAGSEPQVAKERSQRTTGGGGGGGGGGGLGLSVIPDR